MKINKKVKKLSVALAFVLVLTFILTKAFVYLDSKDTVSKVNQYNQAEIVAIETKTEQEIKALKENIVEVKQEDSKDSLDIKEKIIEEDFEFDYSLSLDKVATLNIPVLNLKLPVFKGLYLEEDSMLYGAVTNKTKQELGKGNYVLSSHIVDNKKLLFSNIHSLKTGDIITVSDSKNTYTYTVYNQFVVEGKDLWILNDIEDFSILTLYTCKYTEDNEIIDRTVVRAVLTNIE